MNRFLLGTYYDIQIPHNYHERKCYSANKTHMYKMCFAWGYNINALLEYRKAIHHIQSTTADVRDKCNIGTCYKDTAHQSG